MAAAGPDAGARRAAALPARRLGSRSPTRSCCPTQGARARRAGPGAGARRWRGSGGRLTVFLRPVCRASRATGPRSAGARCSAATGDEMRARAGMLERARQRRAAEQVARQRREARPRPVPGAGQRGRLSSPCRPTWPVAELGRRLDASVRLPGSCRCGWTGRRTPPSPPPRFPSASACPTAGDAGDRRLPRARRGAGRSSGPGTSTGCCATSGHRAAGSRSRRRHRRTRVFDRAGRPAAGARGRGRGWAPALAPLSVWRMTSEQTPVLWPLIAGDGLPPTGAQMGIDLLSGGAFYCDPIGWVTRRRHPGHQPERRRLRQARPRQVRHGQGLPAADDAPTATAPWSSGDTKDEYEPPVPGPGRGAVRHRPRPADGRVNPLDFGPLGHGWERLDRRRGPPPRRAHVRPVAGAGPRPGRLAEAVPCGPFGPPTRPPSVEALRRLTGYRTRRHPAGRGHHPAAVAGPGRTSPTSSSPAAATPTGGTSSTPPARCATRSAPWCKGSCRAVRRPHHVHARLARARSSRCRCPGSSSSATRPSASH